jgi:hypothetical protein
MQAPDYARTHACTHTPPTIINWEVTVVGLAARRQPQHAPKEPYCSVASGCVQVAVQCSACAMDCAGLANAGSVFFETQSDAQLMACTTKRHQLPTNGCDSNTRHN